VSFYPIVWGKTPQDQDTPKGRFLFLIVALPLLTNVKDNTNMTDADAPATNENPLVAFVQSVQQRVKAELERAAAHRWTDVPEPEQPDRQRHRLKWQPAQLKKRPEQSLNIGEARAAMLNQMMMYEASERPGRILLIPAQPGLGKTYAAILTAQHANGRVLYLMPTHAHYDTLRAFPHFDGKLWYHWLATNAPVPGAPGETMCRETKYTEPLMQKGWPLKVACEGLCPLWKATCDYRQQSQTPHKIIAGVHEHVTTGVDIQDFRLVIVDEEPIRAFLRPRHIQADDIATSQYAGPITELYDTLRNLCKSGGKWSGKALLDQIGDILMDVYATIDHFDQLVPAMPHLTERGQVAELPAWFLDDLLILLANEWEAWKAGREDWLERVIVENGRLTLYKRADVWKDIPPRLLIIDATANVEIYQQMFPERKIELYEPPVQQVGRIYQVTGSYLGISQMKDDAKLLEQVELCQAMAQAHGYENPGIVTFKDAVPTFQNVFGIDNVAHFGGQRGSNQLENCDAGFVVGSFSPPDMAVMDMVKMLRRERIEPFKVQELDNGYLLPVRSEKLVSYEYEREDGRQPHRVVSGLWTDPDLNAAMHSRREAEMIQAVHRFRPLTRDVPIWLFSSIPTGLPLVGVYDDPPIGPEGIYWRTWLTIKDKVETAETITIYDLAEWAGASREWVTRQKWLEAIMNYYSDEWQPIKIGRKSAIGRCEL
jgi:hypothetical protein